MKTFRHLFACFFVALMALGSSMPCAAQTEEPTADEVRRQLPGLWQCVVDGKYSMQLKRIDRRGHWENIWLMPEDGQAVFIMKGNYRIDDSGVYLETIEHSFAAEIEGKTSEISVKFIDRNHIKIAYRWNDRPMVEEWVRVQIPSLGGKP